MLGTRVMLWETRNMESNPMREEGWRIRDEWAREAGNDTPSPCQNTRQWAAGGVGLIRSVGARAQRKYPGGGTRVFLEGRAS